MSVLDSIPERAAAAWGPPPFDGATVTDWGKVHRVVETRGWRNPHAAVFTDWRALCGAEGTTSGHQLIGTTGFSHHTAAPRRMLCPSCWSPR